MDRVEIMQRHFYNFNRDPFSAQNLFKDQLSRVSDVDIQILNKAVDDLGMTDGPLPQINKLLAMCYQLTPKPQIGTAPCNICDSIGLVLGVFFCKGDTKMDVVSYSQTVRKDGLYTTSIIGRCKCDNGRAYEQVYGNQMGRIVSPLNFLLHASEEKGWSSNFEAGQCALYYNRKAREWDGNDNGPLKKSLDKYITNNIGGADE